MRAGLAAAALVAAACGGEPVAGARLRALVARPVSDSVTDTLRFETAAFVLACEGGRGALIAGTEGGNGVLVWLRPGDSALAGEYPLVPRGDTAAARGAVVAIRFVLNDVARGVTLDSGGVTARVTGGRLEAQAAGSGVALPGAARVSAEAAFADLAASSDSTRCTAQP